MIREALASLTEQQMQLLRYAFEHGYTQYVELAESKFVGVNCLSVPHLTVTESTGVWAYGFIKGIED
jgi:hypothetical protein